MKDLIIPVNNEALSRALLAVVGETSTAAVCQAYQAIDAAMVFGYARSQEEEAEKREAQAKEYVAALQRSEDRDTKASFDAGFKAGYQAAEEGYRDETDTANEANLQDAFDDGYLDGVHDARVNPEQADDYVAFLVDELYDYDFEAEMAEAYQGDSGDEQPYDGDDNDHGYFCG